MNRLTATLITLNEERNLPRALASLAEVPDEIVVVDSGSTDRTCEIARQHGARVFSRKLTNLGDQKNFAAAQAANDWILSLDADEELSPKLRASLRAWKQQPAAKVAYAFPRKAHYLGGWIYHSGWYPDSKPRLYRRDRGRFVGKPHDSVQADGPVGRLEGELYHHTFRTVEEHLAKVEFFTTLAAEDLFLCGRRRWLPAMLLAPPWAFVHKLIMQAGFLDGSRGWTIARLTARYTFLKYRKLGVLVRGGALKPAVAPEKRPTTVDHSLR